MYILVISFKNFELFDQVVPSSNGVQDYFSSATKYPWLFSMKDKGQTLTSFTNIHKTRNLCITGHVDGTISFWDASCPHLLQIFMIKQQVPSNYNNF